MVVSWLLLLLLLSSSSSSSSLLNAYRTEYFIPADNAWGSLTQNGSWNGMIAMILKGEAEIAVAEFTMTALRAEVVDFTIPLINTRCVFFFSVLFVSFSLSRSFFRFQ
jgi:hypothetical protein